MKFLLTTVIYKNYKLSLKSEKQQVIIETLNNNCALYAYIFEWKKDLLFVTILSRIRLCQAITFSITFFFVTFVSR